MPQAAPGALEIVRAFVNTVDTEAGVDTLTTASELVDWIDASGLGDGAVAADEAALRRFHRLRAALRAILAAHGDATVVPPEVIADLNAIAQRAAVTVRFTGPDTWTVTPQRVGVDGALGRLVAIVVASAGDGTWRRLKICDDSACGWAYYDHSRNRSGRWCSMSVCGNRAKARTFRERHA